MARPTKKELWKQAIAAKVTKLTPEVVKKLLEAFAIDCTVEQACYYAQISERTYYNWVKKNPELLQEFDAMRNALPLKAKHNIAQRIHASDVNLSQWLLERKESNEYGEKVKIEHSGTVDGDEPHPEDEEIRKELKEKLRANIKKRWREKEESKKQKQS